MTVSVTWEQALAWRMPRQLLHPTGRASVADVVRRLCGVQAQVASSAELAIRVRRESSRPGEAARALREGRLVKTWAMRGTLHLLAAEDAGTFLSSTWTANAPTPSPRMPMSSPRRRRPRVVRLLPGFDQYVLGPAPATAASRRLRAARP